MTKLLAIKDAMAENKRQMVEAVYANDQELLRRLSQEKEVLKDRLTRYRSCGQPKSYRALRCWLCAMINRYGRRLVIPATLTVVLIFAGCSTPVTVLAPKPIPAALTPQFSSSSEATKPLLGSTNHVYVPRTNWTERFSWTASTSTNVNGYQVGYFTNWNFNLVWYVGTTTNLYYNFQATNLPGVLTLPAVRAINTNGYVSKWLI